MTRYRSGHPDWTWDEHGNWYKREEPMTDQATEAGLRAGLQAFEPDDPVAGLACENCDGRRCVDCCTRTMHDECIDDCPMCCEEATVDETQHQIKELQAGQQALATQMQALADRMESALMIDPTPPMAPWTPDGAASGSITQPAMPAAGYHPDPYILDNLTWKPADQLEADELDWPTDKPDVYADDYAQQLETHPVVSLNLDDPFDRVIIEVLELNRRKRADYTSGDPFGNFKASGAQVNQPAGVGLEVLLATKQAGLNTLLFTGKEPRNEAVRDTVLDRAVYALIGLAMWDEGLYDVR